MSEEGAKASSPRDNKAKDVWQIIQSQQPPNTQEH